MSKNALMGLVGGVLVVVSVFVADGGFSLDSPWAVITLLAGLVIILGSLIGKLGVAGYGAVGAFTIALVFLYAWIKFGGDITLDFILLLVGSVVALVGTVARKA